MKHSSLNTAALMLAAALFSSTSIIASSNNWDGHFQINYSIPDGFTESLEVRVATKAAYVYVRPPSKLGQLPTMIVFKGMGGVIGRNAPKNANAPDGTLVQFTTKKWKSFDIYTARVPETVKGLKGLNLIADVPLKSEAMTATVFGDANDEVELQALFTTVLAKLDGPSNWVTDYERSYAAGTIAGILLCGVAFWVWRWRKKKTA